MRKYVKQRVPYNEHPEVFPVETINWEAVRVFLVVKRCGSFRGASQELGMALNTVRRQVSLLEREVDCPLLIRNAKGIELTEEGEQLLGVAMEMEKAAYGVKKITKSDVSDCEGRLRISVTEGLGTYWLMPKMVEFQRAHPKVIVELNCTMRKADLLSMDADIAIQLVRPENPDLKHVRLGRMHVMPFASRQYLKTNGTPQSMDDIVNHTIVEQLSPQIDFDAVDKMFPNQPREGFVSVATNTSTAHLLAVEGGAGLGMLPTYLAVLGSELVPVDLDLIVQHDIWLVYNPEMAKLKRVATAIKWIRQAFDPKRYPCFQDDFIHPSDLK